MLVLELTSLEFKRVPPPPPGPRNEVQYLVEPETASFSRARGQVVPRHLCTSEVDLVARGGAHAPRTEKENAVL